MKTIKAVCTHAEKDKLGSFLYEIILNSHFLHIYGNTEEGARKAFIKAHEIANGNTAAQFIVTDIKDEEGNYKIVDTTTGEILDFVAVRNNHSNGRSTWTAAYYIEEKPQEKQKETFREESLF